MTEPLTRRDLLRMGIVAGAGALVTGCGWDGGPLLKPGLTAMARLNDRVGEALVSPHRLAREYPVSERSGSAFPMYYVSDELPVLADPAGWRLTVGGLVANPLTLTLAQLQALPRVTYTVKHHCVEGWTAIATWTGVPLTTITTMAAPTQAARYVRFDSFDSGYYNGWDLQTAMHPQTILAYAYNDQPLRPDHGAPLRLYSPLKLGYKLTKFLTTITFTADRPGGYWEDQGYPWLGGL
ncbi:MAG TPA: molybdopterin-dependent oxidoreductase [Gemmatimonadales bacterium]|nr:molybdopterin-dependent oxidoreductase [Gemmatimonadales bacterium]